MTLNERFHMHVFDYRMHHKTQAYMMLIYFNYFLQIQANRSTLKRRRLKIVFLGDSGTGKSAFILSLCGEPFRETTCTIGLDIRKVELEIDNELTELHLWDTAGQET